MHRQIFNFLCRMRHEFPDVFTYGRILECGSMDVNGGTPRAVFYSPNEYIGIDWQPGPAVDYVSLIHEYRDKPNEYFDVVISTQTLEHDPYWKQSLKRMIELLKPGGTLILTYSGYQEAHCVESSPIEGYYKDLGLWEVINVVTELSKFTEYWYVDDSKCIYAFFKGKK